MIWWVFVGSALLLAVERIAYVLIWHHPGRFRACCAAPIVRRLGQPVDVVRSLFLACKVIQAAVFGAWIYLHGGGDFQPLEAGLMVIAAGSLFILVGQILNFGVFLRLGTAGVFYGSRFGHEVAWCRAFPFSLLSHPQYVGTVLSIWGLFLITRFPHPDWYVLPALETAYYGLGARLEQ
jgi:phosphatidyl-N-methylethanolamine N-methyltransferase